MSASSAPQDGHSAAWQVPGTLEADVRMALSARVSLLLIGQSDAAVEAIWPWLDGPVFAASGGYGLTMPDAGWTGTFLLRDLEHLSAGEQHQLLDWLGRSGGHAQVVSTAAIPLLPRVVTGEFLEALYYRLNMVCVDLAAEPHEGRQAAACAALPQGAILFEWPPHL